MKLVSITIGTVKNPKHFNFQKVVVTYDEGYLVFKTNPAPSYPLTPRFLPFVITQMAKLPPDITSSYKRCRIPSLLDKNR